MDLTTYVRQKYAEAQAEEKVLDVSTFSFKTKKDGNLLVNGLRKTAMPKTADAKSLGKKKMVSGLDIISDNYETYKKVADLLGEKKMAQKYSDLFVKTGLERQRAPRTTPQRGQPKTLAEKLRYAVEKAQKAGDKIVIVSKLNEKGRFRTVASFKDGYTGRILGVEGLPVVSDNYKAFALAMTQLGREDLAEEYYERHVAGKGDKPPAKSLAKSLAKSPGKNASAVERLNHMYFKARDAQAKEPAKYPHGAHLDVSKLALDGTGSRLAAIAANPRGAKTRFSAGVNAPLDPVMISDNMMGFVHVEEILGADFAGLADQWEEDRLTGLHKAPRAKSPVRKTSPKKPVVRARSVSPSKSSDSVSSRGRSLSPFPVMGTTSRSPMRTTSSERVSPRTVSAGRMSPRMMNAERVSPMRTRSTSPKILNVPNRF